MNTKNVARGLVSRFQRLLLALLVATVLFGSFPVGKAHAWAYSVPTGRPGAAGAPTIYVGKLPNLTLYSQTGPTAYRSPASPGAQTVMAVYTVQRWNGSTWAKVTQSGPFVRQISATQQYVNFPAAYILPTISNGSVRVVWSFVWGTSTGTQLGTLVLVPSLASDHVCLIQRCVSVPGYFQIW